MTDDVTCYFVHAATGGVFPAGDPVAWCLDNAGGPLLAAARERLELCDRHADADRILNVVLRRCGLTLVAVRPGSVAVGYWTAAADLRPFFKLHRLARPDVQVVQVHRKAGRAEGVPGDDFLYGERLGGFPWGEYRERWERRGDRQPDDTAASPWCQSSYSWDGVAEGRVPWAALKSAWRREPPTPCPNCDTPLAVWGFTWRHRTLLSMDGHVARGCPGCRRDFREVTGDPWPWVAATLDADALPALQDNGIRKTDLRPRWPGGSTRPVS